MRRRRRSLSCMRSFSAFKWHCLPERGPRLCRALAVRAAVRDEDGSGATRCTTASHRRVGAREPTYPSAKEATCAAGLLAPRARGERAALATARSDRGRSGGRGGGHGGDRQAVSSTDDAGDAVRDALSGRSRPCGSRITRRWSRSGGRPAGKKTPQRQLRALNEIPGRGTRRTSSATAWMAAAAQVVASAASRPPKRRSLSRVCTVLPRRRLTARADDVA